MAFLGGLGVSRGLCRRSWVAFGAFVGGPGPLLGPMQAVLGADQGLSWRSWAALAAYLRGPRPSWDLCWRSWATFGAFVGGLGPLLGPMLAVLGCSWDLCWRSWALLGRNVAQTPVRRFKCGPNPSGKAIWARNHGLLPPQCPEASYGFFL